MRLARGDVHPFSTVNQTKFVRLISLEWISRSNDVDMVSLRSWYFQIRTAIKAGERKLGLQLRLANALCQTLQLPYQRLLKHS
jgi:hypothetical protein